MSGRIRTIKPELLEDAITAGLSHAAFRMFVAMIVLADDHGNLRASPRWLEGQVFHACPLPTDISMPSLLEELAAKLVLFYVVDGQPYAHVTGWSKHQKIDHPSAPRVPLPPGWTVVVREVRNPKTGRRIRVDHFSAPPGAPVATSTEHVATSTEHVATSTDFVAKDHDPDQDHDHDHDHEGEQCARVATAPAEPAPTPAPPPEVQGESEVLAELQRDVALFPGCAVAAAAHRIAVELLAERVASEDGRRVVREAVAYARSWGIDHPLATPPKLLAECERKVTWVLGKLRVDGRIQRDAQRGRARDAPAVESATDFVARELAEAAKLNRELAKRRAVESASGKLRGAVPGGELFGPKTLRFGVGRSSDDVAQVAAAGGRS